MNIPIIEILGRKTAQCFFLPSPSACHEAAEQAGLRILCLGERVGGGRGASGKIFRDFNCEVGILSVYLIKNREVLGWLNGGR